MLYMYLVLLKVNTNDYTIYQVFNNKKSFLEHALKEKLILTYNAEEICTHFRYFIFCFIFCLRFIMPSSGSFSSRIIIT